LSSLIDCFRGVLFP